LRIRIATLYLLAPVLGYHRATTDALFNVFQAIQTQSKQAKRGQINDQNNDQNDKTLIEESPRERIV